MLKRSREPIAGLWKPSVHLAGRDVLGVHRDPVHPAAEPTRDGPGVARAEELVSQRFDEQECATWRRQQGNICLPRNGRDIGACRAERQTEHGAETADSQFPLADPRGGGNSHARSNPFAA